MIDFSYELFNDVHLFFLFAVVHEGEKERGGESTSTRERDRVVSPVCCRTWASWVSLRSSLAVTRGHENAFNWKHFQTYFVLYLKYLYGLSYKICM